MKHKKYFDLRNFNTNADWLENSHDPTERSNILRYIKLTVGLMSAPENFLKQSYQLLIILVLRNHLLIMVWVDIFILIIGCKVAWSLYTILWISDGCRQRFNYSSIQYLGHFNQHKNASVQRAITQSSSLAYTSCSASSSTHHLPQHLPQLPQITQSSFSAA